MADTTFELRVLMGLQAGARLSLADGRYVLGTADAADVLLRGPRIKGEHATLAVDGREVRIAALAGEVRAIDGQRIAADSVLAPGQPVECEGVWLCIDRPDAPWPDLESLVDTRRAGPGPDGAAAPMPETPPAPTGDTEPRPASPVRRPERAPMPSTATVIAALGAVVVVSLLATWVAAPSRSPADPAKTDAGAQASVVGERIRKLGLEERLVVQRAGNGVSVTGAVADEAARDTLNRALSDLRPRPSVKVSTDEETYAAVAPIIARTGLPARFEAVGAGKLRLTVAAPSVDAADQLAVALREELGSSRTLETQVLTPDKLVPALQDLAERGGLAGKVRISQAGRASPHLVASGTIGKADLPAWDRVVEEFRRQFGPLVRVQASFGRVPGSLPFEVRSVVGGATPHVITAAGERVFAGGLVAGYRLVEIRDAEVVFQGDERIMLPRPR